MMTTQSLWTMDFSGPDAIDKAIEAGLDLDGSRIPLEMLNLYREVMDKEGARKRSGVKKLGVHFSTTAPQLKACA